MKLMEISKQIFWLQAIQPFPDHFSPWQFCLSNWESMGSPWQKGGAFWPGQPQKRVDLLDLGQSMAGLRAPVLASPGPRAISHPPSGPLTLPGDKGKAADSFMGTSIKPLMWNHAASSSLNWRWIGWWTSDGQGIAWTATSRGCQWHQGQGVSLRSLYWDQECLFHILIIDMNEGMEGTLSTSAGDTELRDRDTPEGWGHP